MVRTARSAPLFRRRRLPTPQAPPKQTVSPHLPPPPCPSFKCNGVGFQRHYGGYRAVHPGILCTCSTSGRNRHTDRSPSQARQAGWPIHNSRTFRSNHVFSGSYCCIRVPLFPLFHCVRRCCRLAGATECSARSCHVV